VTPWVTGGCQSVIVARPEILLFKQVADGTIVAHYNGPCGGGSDRQFP
jgi:hypothetical protein